jgi:hypothetical protein
MRLREDGEKDARDVEGGCSSDGEDEGKALAFVRGGKIMVRGRSVHMRIRR